MTCALCQEPTGSKNIVEDTLSFCCHGCRAVYAILAAKGQLAGYESHPVFLQALRAGLISNPLLLEQVQKRRAETAQLAREKIFLEIAGMWCPSCAELVHLMLEKERGVASCVVDYATDLASIEYVPQCISKDTLFEQIRSLGYTPASLESREGKTREKELHWRCAVAAFCSLNIMMFAYPLYATWFDYDGGGYGNLFAWLSFFTALPVLFYSAMPIWRRCAVSLRTGFFGMETLVATGVGAAFAVSVWELWRGGNQVYFDSLSVILFFVLLGKIIENRAKFSAKEALMRLNRASPRRGRKRLPDGTLLFVPLKEVAKGECLIAYAGEKIPLDGIVCEGAGSVDESLMTGEALPLTKKAGDTLLGGSIVVQGWIACTVTHGLEETVLAKIIQLVERDIGHKSVYIRAADQIVRWFVPCVILIACMTAAWCLLFPTSGESSYQTALVRALSVLLISCPCAIGIAAPAAESCLLNRLAAMGVLVRNRGALPHLGRATVWIFDKTGTVTEGVYRVLSGLETLVASDKQVLAALASHSTHPVSQAIAAALSGEGRVPLDKFEEVSGLGVRATVQGKEYLLGSARFLAMESGREFSECSQKEGIVTKVYFAQEGGELLAEIALGDRVRPEIAGLLAELKPARALLLSGDTEAPVAAAAKQCGFDAWHSSATPLDKRAFVEQLKAQGEVVCMVGDGINDAPALTLAHAGISVVSAADLSIQVSDLLLTSDNLSVLKKIQNVCTQGQRIIKENLFWAFFYNLIGIGMAVAGLLTPVFAAIAMSLSSLCVLFNAKRIDQ
jgi:heavy metal translocating P-type ATPase